MCIYVYIKYIYSKGKRLLKKLGLSDVIPKWWARTTLHHFPPRNLEISSLLMEELSARFRKFDSSSARTSSMNLSRRQRKSGERGVGKVLGGRGTNGDDVHRILKKIIGTGGCWMVNDRNFNGEWLRVESREGSFFFTRASSSFIEDFLQVWLRERNAVFSNLWIDMEYASTQWGYWIYLNSIKYFHGYIIYI